MLHHLAGMREIVWVGHPRSRVVWAHARRAPRSRPSSAGHRLLEHGLGTLLDCNQVQSSAIKCNQVQSAGHRLLEHGLGAFLGHAHILELEAELLHVHWRAAAAVAL